MSQRTSAHVHSVFHVNFSTVARIREQKKADYEQLGRSSPTWPSSPRPSSLLRRFPVVNASLDGDNIVYKDINLGIAVALEAGLIVPVVKLGREEPARTEPLDRRPGRARTRKAAQADDVQGGVYHYQPRPVRLAVRDANHQPAAGRHSRRRHNRKASRRRRRCNRDSDDGVSTLGYDHRLIDGATGDQFMAEVKQQIENFDPKSA